MSTTASETADIRAAYKARGWKSSQISVRSKYYAGGSSINVVLKDATIPFAEVKRIAQGAERISRCEMTGEILSGGNRFVHVRMSEHVEVELAKAWAPALDAAIAALRAHGENNVLMPIGESGYSVGFDRQDPNGILALWGHSSHVRCFYDDACGRRDACVKIALALQGGGA